MLRVFIFLSMFSVSAMAADDSGRTPVSERPRSEAALPWQVLQTAEPLNCVNPGGSCDGSVPCCDSYNNACIRNQCRRLADGPYNN